MKTVEFFRPISQHSNSEIRIMLLRQVADKDAGLPYSPETIIRLETLLKQRKGR